MLPKTMVYKMRQLNIEQIVQASLAFGLVELPEYKYKACDFTWV